MHRQPVPERETDSSAPFLSGLRSADLAELGARWHVRHYNRNETIIAHEDSDRDVFFVLEGRARATLFSKAGRTIAYRDIEPGSIFGELAAIDGAVRSATVIALERAKVARIAQATFRQLINENPAFAWALLGHLSTQIRRLTNRIYEFSTLVVRKRLIRELLRLAGAPEGCGGVGTITPAPTHYDLAAKISTHREAVSREMSALAKKGLVKRRGSSLVLPDLGTLSQLGRTEQGE